MRGGNLSETRTSLRFAVFFSLMMIALEVIAWFIGEILAAFQAMVVVWATIGTIAIYRDYRQRLRAEMARLAAEYDRLCRAELIRQIESLA